MKVTVGCDPELFLYHNGEPISAFGLFPGTKSEPYKLNKGAVQVDGMALEFNIDPASSEEEFEDNMSTVLKQIKQMVHDVNPEFEMRFEPLAKFDPEYFKLLPLEPKVLGCDPDFDIDGNQKTPTEELMFTPIRTAAGHVHIGFPTYTSNPYSSSHFEDCKHVSKLFLNSKMFIPKTEAEKERIKYYGTPGSFRPKSYGVELRTPSNRWVARKETRKQMYREITGRMSSL